MPPRHPLVRAVGIASLVAACIALAACAATREYRRGIPKQSGFLGDYSELKHNPEYPAAEVYINPDADWPSYDAVEIDSVTLWVTKERGRLTPDERQMLTDTLYTALHDQIGRYIKLTDQPGPSTIRLRAALTEVKGANIPLRTITTVVPQLRILSAAVGLSADVAETVGTATVEVALVDSITGRRLAAAVDSRAGNKALFSLRTFQKWGDVEAACNLWAQRVAWQLVRQGVRRKPDAPEPETPREPRTL